MVETDRETDESDIWWEYRLETYYGFQKSLAVVGKTQRN